jgi:8-amino-7-oxononanoate synthase
VKQTPVALRHLDDQLRGLDGAGLLRVRPDPVLDVARSFCSNDYLGLAGDLVVPAPSGAGASRLIVGERPEHLALETALATWLATESALVFSSGYAANVGVLSALAGPSDVIFSDRLNHASIIDGSRVSRARVTVFDHLNLDALEAALLPPREGRAWVVTESYFSMDADSPDLPALRDLCDRHGAALIVDEAHAIGALGPRGRGLCAEHAIVPDVLIGTLGKAFGASGAFVAGSQTLTHWLWNRARSFVFSTGVSPVVATAARRSLRVIEEDEPRRERLHQNARRLRDGLARLGLPLRGYGPIIPVVLGSPDVALRAASSLRDEGVHVQAVRPPTVPAGTARLRITTTASHTENDIDRALRAFQLTMPWLTSAS